jgi:hypothetical protein
MDNLALLRELLGDLWGDGYIDEVYGHWDYESTNVGLNDLGEVVIWDLSKLPETDCRFNLADPDLIGKLRANVKARMVEHDNKE